MVGLDNAMDWKCARLEGCFFGSLSTTLQPQLLLVLNLQHLLWTGLELSVWVSSFDG